DSSRDADVQAPRAKNRVEGKLEATPGDTVARGKAHSPEATPPTAAPAAPAPQAELRADAQAAAKRQAAPLGAASFVPPDVSAGGGPAPRRPAARTSADPGARRTPGNFRRLLRSNSSGGQIRWIRSAAGNIRRKRDEKSDDRVVHALSSTGSPCRARARQSS